MMVWLNFQAIFIAVGLLAITTYGFVEGPLFEMV